ncbi:ATP-binding protein [Nocardioides humilatus]|uniref:ATP-binding protein n=1 Tax=Nocardioides humilatus TaxID=2607660 RepID=UPI00165F1E8B|nr:adenylate/guanylate cyclase domain-containing protein [Nocardioides humilatus]
MGAEQCPQCRRELPPEARFCAYCGITLEPTVARPPAPSATPARAERRVITALFADLAGSTQLGERLDPEDFRDLTGGALALMGAAIEELGGTVRGTAGDGVLGLFGAPTAHEDDAERAVIAGLRLVSRLRDYGVDAAERWGVADLRVRVGIETGLAVLGEVRAGSQVQYDASGDCLNTAARLEGAADHGGVLVGPLTHRIISDAFDWGELRPLALKGKAEAVLARHALGARADHVRHGPAAGSRLVGRVSELATAGAVAVAVREGASRIAFVTGAAGIGKTRFMSEFRRLFEAAAPDAPATIWLSGTCVSYGLDEPYLPFRQVLRQALGRGVDSFDKAHEALAALVGKERAAEVAPVLGLILGLAPGDEVAARMATWSAESLQQAVIDAFAELVAGLAALGPVAIALDDLHWADAASLRLIEGLVEELADTDPVLVVLAMRPEGDRPAWALRERTVSRRPQLSVELSLTSLARDDELGLISDLVGAGTLPEELETLLLGRAEGNPFYLRELLRSLQDTGAIVQSQGRWTFDTTVTVEVPDTIERVVLARIDRLSPGDRDLLSSAAVIGREFDLALLGRIVGADLSSDSLVNLTRLGLFEVGAGAELRFSHPLIQETAYTSMLRRGRADLHARAAAAIEELADDGSVEHAAVLARHHAAAGHLAEAVKYHRLAAIAAQRVVAIDEAMNQFDLAIEAAGALDPAAARAQLPELHLLRGSARGRFGDYPGGTVDLRLSLEGARLIGDEQVEMLALNELGWLMRVHGYEESLGLHQEALRIAEKRDDPATQVSALHRMSLLHLNRLRLDDGLELAQRALGIARATGQDRVLGTALDCLKLAALQLGDLELLERTVAEIIAVQERAGDAYLLQWAYIEGASVPLARGDRAGATQRIERAAEINAGFTFDRLSLALILEARSWIDRANDDVDAAVSALHAALVTVGDQITPEWSAWLGASLGSHLIEQGRPAEAITLLEDAWEKSDAIKSPNRAFRAASHLALAYQQVGDAAGSRDAMRRAQDVLATVTAPPGTIFMDGYRSYLAMARTSIAVGDPGAAQELLVPVLDAARRHGWTTAEREVAAMLDQLAASRPDQR